MKNIVVVFAAAALGMGLAFYLIEDNEADSFNPVRDRLEEKGLLEEAIQDRGLTQKCNYMQSLNEMYDTPAITKTDMNMVADVYECNAVGHKGFQTVVFNEYLIDKPAGFNKEDTKDLLRKMVEFDLQDECVPFTEEDKNAVNYNALKRLCRAYDLPG